MSRLDDTISEVAYILEALKAYRNIVQSGNCNTCDNRDCKWKPKLGQFIRYNCPHFKEFYTDD